MILGTRASPLVLLHLASMRLSTCVPHTHIIPNSSLTAIKWVKLCDVNADVSLFMRVRIKPVGAPGPIVVAKLSDDTPWAEFRLATRQRLGIVDDRDGEVRVFLEPDGAEVKQLQDVEEGDLLSVTFDGSGWRPPARDAAQDEGSSAADALHNPPPTRHPPPRHPSLPPLPPHPCTSQLVLPQPPPPPPQPLPSPPSPPAPLPWVDSAPSLASVFGTGQSQPTVRTREKPSQALVFFRGSCPVRRRCNTTSLSTPAWSCILHVCFGNMLHALCAAAAVCAQLQASMAWRHLPCSAWTIGPPRSDAIHSR